VRVICIEGAKEMGIELEMSSAVAAAVIILCRQVCDVCFGSFTYTAQCSQHIKSAYNIIYNIHSTLYHACIVFFIPFSCAVTGSRHNEEWHLASYYILKPQEK
jgi:hypothetical protein